jgi:serine/threonine-protein kinase
VGSNDSPVETAQRASPPRAPDALLGAVVEGKYRILDAVAAGGMGKVYRAQQIALDRIVAFKVLRVTSESTEQEERFKRRFFREASILARLQHPNIVTVFDYGAFSGAFGEQYYIAMEYLSGETLADRITRQKRLGVAETVAIGRQVARGLAEAHASGAIHRDLKPTNVMLLKGRDGEDFAKIVDFGIVKVATDASDPGDELTEEGSFVGSPKHTAPEQVAGRSKIDARADVYSFGILLYECLTGTVPFEGESSVMTLMAHLTEPVPPMSERAPGVEIPGWLDQLVTRCLEKAPEARPQTMDAVGRALGSAGAEPLTVPSLAPAAAPPRPPAPPDAQDASGSRLVLRDTTSGGTATSVYDETLLAAPADAGTPARPALWKRTSVRLGFACVAVCIGALVALDLRRHEGVHPAERAPASSTDVTTDAPVLARPVPTPSAAAAAATPSATLAAAVAAAPSASTGVGHSTGHAPPQGGKAAARPPGAPSPSGELDIRLTR